VIGASGVGIALTRVSSVARIARLNIVVELLMLVAIEIPGNYGLSFISSGGVQGRVVSEVRFPRQDDR
jgi:hypothetical protein